MRARRGRQARNQWLQPLALTVLGLPGARKPHALGSQGTTPLNLKVYEAATQVSSFSWKFQKWRLVLGGTNNQGVPGPLRCSSASQTVPDCSEEHRRWSLQRPSGAI